MSVQSPSGACRPSSSARRARPSILAAVERGLHGGAQFGRTHRDADARSLQRRNLVCRAAVSARDDRPRMAHPAPRGRGLSCNEGDHRLLKVLLYICRGLFLSGAADLADKNHRVGASVLVEQLQNVDLAGPNYRVAADPDAGRLPDTELGELMHRLISQRTRTRDHADAAGLVNVARHDTDFAF